MAEAMTLQTSSRSVGGRCHAEAHGTAIPERHTYQRTSWEDRQSLAEEYEQACTEYICDYYANMGVIADPVNGGGL